MRVRTNATRRASVSAAETSLTILCAPDAIRVNKDSGTIVIPTSVGALCIPLVRVVSVDPASFGRHLKGCTIALGGPEASVGIVFEGVQEQRSSLAAGERLRLSIMSARIEHALDRILDDGPNFAFAAER